MAFYVLPTRRFLKVHINFSLPFFKQWIPIFVITNTLPPTRAVQEILPVSDLQVSELTTHLGFVSSKLQKHPTHKFWHQHWKSRCPCSTLHKGSQQADIKLPLPTAHGLCKLQLCLSVLPCQRSFPCFMQCFFLWKSALTCHRLGLALPGLFFPPLLLPLTSSHCLRATQDSSCSFLST